MTQDCKPCEVDLFSDFLLKYHRRDSLQSFGCFRLSVGNAQDVFQSRFQCDLSLGSQDTLLFNLYLHHLHVSDSVENRFGTEEGRLCHGHFERALHPVPRL